MALGRKNYLFAGHNEGARNLAVLMSLVVTCEANGINPHEYLADVLLRVQDQPQSKIDDLIPTKWAKISRLKPFPLSHGGRGIQHAEG